MKDSIQFIELIVVGGEQFTEIYIEILPFCRSHSRVCLPVMLVTLPSNFLVMHYVATVRKLCGQAKVLDHWPNCVVGS